MVHCAACGVVPVPVAQLPIQLPNEVDFSEPGNPLERHPSWKTCDCPQCGQPARRETDTMDTFMESSWYFLRYCSPHMGGVPLDKAAVDRWMPVNQYVGGIEHAVLHLLYARFFHKALRDIGEVSCDEPFARLLTQGMVRKDTHRCAQHGWRYPKEVQERDGALYCIECGGAVTVGRNEKMSKSKHNVVDPNDLIAGYGADTARLFMLFAAPADRDLEWNDSGVDGAWRFLGRVWRLVLAAIERCGERQACTTTPADEQLKAFRSQLHNTIVKVTEDLNRQSFNTAIAAVMEMSNGAIATFKGEDRLTGEASALLWETAQVTVKLLHPYAPHMTEELWQRMGEQSLLSDTPWPLADAAALVKERVLIVIQVNGKLRSKLEVPVDMAQEAIEKLALADEHVKVQTEGKTIRKVVVVPGRLVNIVAN